MNILERLNDVEEALKILNESGIRNIRKWAKNFRTATGYFHQDL